MKAATGRFSTPESLTTESFGHIREVLSLLRTGIRVSDGGEALVDVNLVRLPPDIGIITSMGPQSPSGAVTELTGMSSTTPYTDLHNIPQRLGGLLSLSIVPRLGEDAARSGDGWPSNVQPTPPSYPASTSLGFATESRRRTSP